MERVCVCAMYPFFVGVLTPTRALHGSYIDLASILHDFTYLRYPKFRSWQDFCLEHTAFHLETTCCILELGSLKVTLWTCSKHKYPTSDSFARTLQIHPISMRLQGENGWKLYVDWDGRGSSSRLPPSEPPSLAPTAFGGAADALEKGPSSWQSISVILIILQQCLEE